MFGWIQRHLLIHTWFSSLIILRTLSIRNNYLEANVLNYAQKPVLSNFCAVSFTIFCTSQVLNFTGVSLSVTMLFLKEVERSANLTLHTGSNYYSLYWCFCIFSALLNISIGFFLGFSRILSCKVYWIFSEYLTLDFCHLAFQNLSQI